MDIKTLLNNLHEEVSCSVCMDTFRDPKQLPCMHSFCLICLQGIQRNSGRHDVITCPECRRESRVPGGGNLNELPTNFRINSLLDVLAIRECNTTGVKCGNCDKKSSQSLYCFQCCAFWCDDCVTGHNIMRGNKGHRVLAIMEFRDEDIEEVLKRPAFCSKPGHEKKELEFFCKKCAEPICSSCVATIHDGHVKILLDDAANEKKLEFQTVIESQKEKAKQMRNKIAELDENCLKIQAQVASVKRSVEHFADSMMAVIEANKQEMLEDVENQGKHSLQRLEKQKSEFENGAKMFETAAEKTETRLRRSTSAQILQIDNTAFQEVEHDEEQVNYDLDEGFRRFVFVRNETLMEKAISEGIGSFKTFLSKTEANKSSAEGKGLSEATVGLEAQFKLTTRNAEGEQCYEERDCVTVEIRNRQGHDCGTVKRVQDNKDGMYSISYFAKETGQCEVTVKVNEDHVQESPFSVQFKPRQYRPVLSFGQQGRAAGMLNLPWGVTVNERNEIAVTDVGNNRVQISSSDGTYLRSFGKKGDKQGEFDCPAGIAFDKKGNIIVVDRNNHRVQVFNEQGKFLNQFGEQGSLDHQLKDPYGVSVDSDGNIIVADRGNKLIKIFSPGGQFLRIIGGEGFFSFPYHCVQFSKYIIVSDSDEHCIKVFNRDGHFQYKFGKQGGEDGKFDKPRCLSIDKAGHLVVCDGWNHRVQVFELSGKLVIKKFGSKGSEIGEFNRPVSTAVLSDGRIVVTDICNHRLQVFE